MIAIPKDREDIGNVGAQLPSGKMGIVSSLFPEWQDWVDSKNRA